MNRNASLPPNAAAVVEASEFLQSQNLQVGRFRRFDQQQYSPTSRSKRPLPADYTPSPHSVVIGRGKFCTDASGSKRLRLIASTFLDQYTKATTKVAKSKVVSSIVSIIEDACPYGGGFVKFASGKWWEVDTSAAREKVGYVLRDLLHDKYRSSSKSKAANRRMKNAKRKSSSRDEDESCSLSSTESIAKPSFSNEELQLQRRTRGSSSENLEAPNFFEVGQGSASGPERHDSEIHNDKINDKIVELSQENEPNEICSMQAALTPHSPVPEHPLPAEAEVLPDWTSSEEQDSILPSGLEPPEQIASTQDWLRDWSQQSHVGMSQHHCHSQNYTIESLPTNGTSDGSPNDAQLSLLGHVRCDPSPLDETELSEIFD